MERRHYPVLDAVTGNMLSESPPISSEDWKLLFECVAASQAGGRVLVATGHEDGMVRVWETKSGKLIGQRQTPSNVEEVLIDAAARRVMTRCGDDILRVWSLAGDDSSMDQDDARAAALRDKEVFARPQHMGAWAVVGLSPHR
jgi:hypothetical protein